MASNVQKTWEALAEIRLLLVRVPRSIRSDVACGIIAAKAKAALAEPPRNCDVGTPEEQDKRFDAFCKSYKEHHGNCFGCAALRTSGDCKVSWMRMPCEGKGSEG